MEYKKDYFGYVYEWTNSANNMKYIGSHFGSVHDCYKGSGKYFIAAYNKTPHYFTMKVLEYVTENNKKKVLLTEQKWLNTVKDIQNDPMYYNLKADASGGFRYQNTNHISKRAETLKNKHKTVGLSEKEISSYKTKIKTKLDRISTHGFTKKEQEQHKKFSTQVKIILPTGEEKIYYSISEATRELGIDVRYGLVVCTKKIDFKGYKIIKIRDPIIDCRKK